MTDAHSNLDSSAIDALVSIIMNRRRRVLEALSVMGLDLELEVPGVEVTLEGGGYRIVTGHTQSVPAVALRSIRDRLLFAVDFGFPDDTELAATEMILSSLGDSYHQLWTTISPEDKEDVAPAIVVFQDRFWPLADYFISLAPSDDEAGDLAQRLSKDVLASLASGTGKVVERAALGGIRVQEPITVGRLLIRPLTPPELREVAGRWNYGDLDLTEPDLVQPERELGLRGTAALECRTDCDATSSPPDPYLAERAILAMQLLDIRMDQHVDGTCP